MVHRVRKSVRFVVFLVAWVPFLGCNTLPPLGVPRGPDETDENFVVFADPDSEFSTTDVRDVDEEIVHFDAVAKTLIWAADNIAFEGWEVSGNFVGARRQFQVRFGTKHGERRAYLTETERATICQVFVLFGRLWLLPTNVMVPTS